MVTVESTEGRKRRNKTAAGAALSRDAAQTAARPDPLDPAGCHRRAREGAARVLLAVAARPGGAQRRERADALAGRARRDEPDADSRDADRRGLELRLSQLLRLDEEGAVTIVRAGERQRGGNKRRGHSFEVLTSSQPGQRAELSRHTLAPGGATGRR
jgi:hypothetical protein